MRAGADQAALEKFDEFANKFSDTGEQLNGLLSDAPIRRRHCAKPCCSSVATLALL
jgi:hypothetical protein